MRIERSIVPEAGEHYVVEVDGERTIGECLSVDLDGTVTWSQIGIDYDIWQYTNRGALPVKVLAHLDLNNLKMDVA